MNGPYPHPGARTYHWPTEAALELLHGTNRCETCGGREWVATPDPLYDDVLIDARCPDCARKARDE